MVRGIRGATTVTVNDAEAIIQATSKLLLEIQQANGLHVEDLCAVFFTTTPDLDAAFPARAARQLGWQHVPLLDMQQAGHSSDLKHCIRVMVLANCSRSQSEMKHVYHGEARSLRPDLVKGEQE